MVLYPKFMVCNHFNCFIFCLLLCHYNPRGYPVVGEVFLKAIRLDRNDSISFNCMVCNHFVAFSVCWRVMITEFARCNETKLTLVACGGRPHVE